jgi:hypothetical protein
MTAVAPELATPEATAAASYGQRMSAEQRRNVWLLGLDMAIFSMGLGALGQLTVIPLFVSKLTENPLAIGAVAAAIQIGWLTQLVVAGAVERRAQKWPWVTRFSTYERLPSLTLALCALAAAYTGWWILPVVYLCCFSQTLFGGLCVGPWMDVISRVVPGRLRGRFMGTSNTVGALLAPSAIWLLASFVLLGVVQSANLLTRVTGPIEYAPIERRPSYVALAFGVVGPFAALAPLLGGQIVVLFGYGWLFGLSAAVALVSVLVLGAGARPSARRT